MNSLRIKKVQEDLKKAKIDPDSIGVDAFLVSSPVNIEYLTGYPNFSKAEREAYLFITRTDATLFTDPRYIEAVEKVLPDNIKATIERPASKIINQIVKDLKIQRIGFESNFTFAEYKRFKKVVDAKLVLVEDFVEKHREIKDADEVSAIRRAAQLTDKTFTEIQSNIRTNVGLNITEKEVAWRIEKFIKENGGELAFDSIVAFGPNSSIPHHSPTNKTLSDSDEFIKLDFGAKVDSDLIGVDGYCCDMTRTILTKHASTRAKKVYKTVLDSQTAAIKYLNETKNPTGKSAFETAEKIITTAGFSSIPHGLGHGIGLEVHEAPILHNRIDDKLLDGMVFSVEPGIYIPGFGGVRIEDTCLFLNGKIEQLTKSPK